MSVGERKIWDRGAGVVMASNGDVLESSDRKITVSAIRVTAWGLGREEELAMP